MSMVCRFHYEEYEAEQAKHRSGLSQRAGHPRSSLQLLHGSLFDIKCTDFYCKYTQADNFTDPIVPALAIPTTSSGAEVDPTTDEARNHISNGHDSSSHISHDPSQTQTEELDISDEKVQIPKLTPKDLPRCPQCGTGLLRPGVVWFGEMLPERTIRSIDDWISSAPQIDLIMVIGTSARVYPAAGYVQRARAKGARVAVVNTDSNDAPQGGLMSGDWFFCGDAAEVVPRMLDPLVGDVGKMLDGDPNAGR